MKHKQDDDGVSCHIIVKAGGVMFLFVILSVIHFVCLSVCRSVVLAVNAETDIDQSWSARATRDPLAVINFYDVDVGSVFHLREH